MIPKVRSSRVIDGGHRRSLYFPELIETSDFVWGKEFGFEDSLLSAALLE